MSINLQHNEVTINTRVWSQYSRLLGTGVFWCAFILYLFTLAPTVIWGDSAKFALNAIEMNLSIGADSHPLFVILGRLFSYLPFEIAYSINLLSAVTASFAVLVAYFVIIEITEDWLSAVVGAAALTLSHAFWLHAVIAEVYDLNSLFVLLIVLVLLKWKKDTKNYRLIYLAAFLFGLGLSNHLIMILTGFGFFYFILVNDHKILFKPKVLIFILCSFWVGSSILIYLFLKKIFAGSTVAKIVDVSTGRQHKDQMFIFSLDIFKDLFMYFAYLFYQFPFVGFIFGYTGILSLLKYRKKEAFFFLLLIVINLIFFVCFGPGLKRTTKYTFYISDYAVFSILIGCGFFAIKNFFINKGYSARRIFLMGLIPTVLCPVFLYNITPIICKFLAIDLLHARTIPYRDNNDFFLIPSKRNYMGANQYAEEALKSVESNSIIIADYSPLTVLKYTQLVKEIRNDINIIDIKEYRHDVLSKIVFQYYGKQDLYLADLERGYYNIKKLEKNFKFVPDGVLFRVERRN